jgi:hypothetical protein
MLGEGACWPRTRLPETEPLKRSAEHVGQARQLLKADLLTGNDLGLQALDLDSQRSSLPDEILLGSLSLSCPPRSSARAIARSR